MSSQRFSLSLRTGITAALLILVGTGGRMLLQDMPNIETITAVTVIAAALLGGPWGAVVGLISVAISDILIGNTSILLYTWSGWVLVGGAALLARYRGQKTSRAVLAITGTGLLGNMIFFVWTNFGVWHIGDLYQHTWSGLVECYIAAIPFLRNQLISTLIFVPAGSVAAIALWKKSFALSVQSKAVSRSLGQRVRS